MPFIAGYRTCVLRLYDTAGGSVRELVPLEPDRVSMYVCGPTVYDEPHLGHGRFSVVFDILRRYLEWSGLEVTYVSNVTDVDDKIIARAKAEGVSTDALARRYEQAWFEAMSRLGVAPPTQAPRATAYIPQMLDLVERLVNAGHAYTTDDGVYLEVGTIPGYGLLARQPLESLQAGARVSAEAQKRSPLDFALWKLAKPDEPRWPSPFGDGRPGWHTECVAMALDLLGGEFDLHCGGADLAFPHHENERAQAGALGKPFARHWCHNGWVVDAEGEKMSKSLGNYSSLTDLLARTDGRAYRLIVARAHYRSPLVVSAATIADAERALGRLEALALRAGAASEGMSPAEPDRRALERFASSMDDDLDTPGAVAGIFECVRAANVAFDAGDAPSGLRLAAGVSEACKVLGLTPWPAGDAAGAEVGELVRLRNQARADRDFERADGLRGQLLDRGWVLEDTPGGTRLRRAPG